MSQIAQENGQIANALHDIADAIRILARALGDEEPAEQVDENRDEFLG